MEGIKKEYNKIKKRETRETGHISIDWYIIVLKRRERFPRRDDWEGDFVQWETS